MTLERLDPDEQRRRLDAAQNGTAPATFANFIDMMEAYTGYRMPADLRQQALAPSDTPKKTRKISSRSKSVNT